MSEFETWQLATLSIALLAVWDLVRRDWRAVAFSILALIPIALVDRDVARALTIVLLLPPVFEERRKRKKTKDYVRAVLSAAGIAATIALILVY